MNGQDFTEHDARTSGAGSDEFQNILPEPAISTEAVEVPAQPDPSPMVPNPEETSDNPAVQPAKFGISTVRSLARSLSERAYKPSPELPKQAAQLNYDQYRRIEPLPASMIWKEAGGPFRAFLDPRGYLFTQDVKINVVSDGQVVEQAYAASNFDFFDLPLADDVKEALGFSGVRILAPINRAGKLDEIISFRGASFFRALGTGTVYGASARGLSIGTASKEGEEFPYFREFWLVQPQQHAEEITIYALLDGKSITGAFEFKVNPGPETIVDVSATFFPRQKISSVGIAPLTSMYFFSPHDVRKFSEDYRPAVHDSQGFAIHMNNGEWVWRPLINPQALQVSILAGEIPRGFGLLQRKRDFAAYGDIEAQYHHRPNVWIEPRSGWGDGQLTLVEIPTTNEYNDNVVTFWRPADAWKKGETYSLSYQMRWSLMPPGISEVVSIVETRAGLQPGSNRQLFVIDYDTADEELVEGAEPEISTSVGRVFNPVVKRHPQTGMTRFSFEFEPGDADLAELRALLTKGGKPVTETWLYRWRSE